MIPQSHTFPLHHIQVRANLPFGTLQHRLVSNKRARKMLRIAPELPGHLRQLHGEFFLQCRRPVLLLLQQRFF